MQGLPLDRCQTRMLLSRNYKQSVHDSWHECQTCTRYSAQSDDGPYTCRVPSDLQNLAIQQSGSYAFPAILSQIFVRHRLTMGCTYAGVLLIYRSLLSSWSTDTLVQTMGSDIKATPCHVLAAKSALDQAGRWIAKRLTARDHAD